MAELVAEAFLSAAFQKILDRLTSREFMSFFRGKKSIDKQLKALKEKIKTASLLLNDAEDRQISEPDVKQWLDELKHVTMRAEDLVEYINDEARTNHQELESGERMLSGLWNSIFPSFTEFDKTVQGEIASLLEDLNFLSERADVLRLKHIDGTAQSTRSSPRLPAPLRDERHIYGRDADKEEILRLLLSGDIWGNKMGVIPIVGMGGLGKTTLAQLVYDDDRVKERGFQLKAWVTVSTEFDISKIIKLIMEQVCPKTPQTEEPTELQRRLKEALRGKKFLFVLDDVWDEDYENWDFLQCTFASEESASRIIVTTRSKKVASIVKVGELVYELSEVSELDCWKIFVDHALNGDLDADPHLQEIGKKFVEKCKGLPLAVKSIGGLLRSERDPNKWESILRSRVWESPGSGILPSLWLSYRYLPSCLKRCFAYCSIFPKDFEMKKETVILLWMAEGFLQSDKKEKRLEEVGQQYLDDLMSRSLFQNSSRDESKFVMHDLMHDLAILVSGEFCFRFDLDLNLKHLTKKTRHISHYKSGKDRESWKDCFEAKHIRTFIELWKDCFEAKPVRIFIELYRHISDCELVGEVLRGGRYLRVLSLSKVTKIQMLLETFSNLKHLRYLDLSWSNIEELPCSICTLYNLQTLLLVHCERLIRLPTDMGRLINLRHLKTTGTPLKEMPPHMGNLTELQTNFVLGEHDTGSSIKELGKLQQLGGELCISGLQYVHDVKDVEKENLAKKVNLSELTLKWQGDVSDTRTAKEALIGLRPHTNLKKLDIYNYAGSNFPDWLGHSSFSKIVRIHLSGNEYCWSLPPLGQLPSLQELVIESFHGVQEIGDEFYGTGNNSSPFQSLQILKFSDMKRWEEWSIIGREGKCFPCLKKLCFKGCPNLVGSLPDCDTLETLKISESYKSMESLPLDHFPELKTLKLMSCENLESLTFTEETGTALKSPISELVIENCKNFRSLPEHMHRLLPSLSDLWVSSCPEIESFPKGGLPPNLHNLSIYNCCKLVAQHRHWDLQGLASLRGLEIRNCQDVTLDSFPEGWLLPCSLTSFTLDNLPHLKTLNGSAFTKAESLAELRIWGCKEIQCLPDEILLRPSLHSLTIWECPVLERRYRRGKGEDWHKISQLQYTAINGVTTSETEDSASTNV